MSNILSIKLKEKLDEVVDDFHGIIGVAIKDIEYEDEILINANEIFPIASSIKIPILLEFFRKVENGDINPDKLITYEDKHRTIGSGVLKELQGGKVTMSLLDYATLMITVSDNAATNIIIDAVGLDDVNNTLNNLGLTITKLICMKNYLKSIAEKKYLLSTPKEMMNLLYIIYKEKGLPHKVCENLVNILKKRKEGFIRNAIPDDIEIADKSGWIGGVSNDVGIVFLPRRPYIISILSKNIKISDPKKLKANYMLTKISKIVYEYFLELDISTPYGEHILKS